MSLRSWTVVALAASAATFAQAPEQRALDAVRTEIEQLQARLARENASLEREYAELERAERASSTAAAALQDVRARVAANRRQGESLALIGPNGAGKTTIFSLIMGEIRQNSGSITSLG